MNPKPIQFNVKEWIYCSAIAVIFYAVVYVLLAYKFWGFTNIWLILVCVVFAATDILGLLWWSKRQSRDQNHDSES
ncbi:MAG: hypothetical protein JXR73_20640 [Candidatus Omnitrophica bacterium]|nr:hypothetical protein [Candidatus Omnitrophota bacterium]